MISLDSIKSHYPESLHRFPDFLLREFLQYQILDIIFSGPFASKLCFLGGTCLRIVHNNQRFSEDLDFDNFDLTANDFEKVSENIQKSLELRGYQVQMRNVMRGAYHCYIKFPGLLFDIGLSGHLEEKILIQLDTEPQHFNFSPEPFFLNKFDVFSRIFITPVDILLSQKFLTICQRKKHKGRDFFDIVFLMGKTLPDYQFLEQKLGVSDAGSLKEMVLKICAKIDFEEMARDVQPFLFKPQDVSRVVHFEAYIEQNLK